MTTSDTKIAIVVSRFNNTITEKLLQNALKYLETHGLAKHQIYIADVPGAIEIPLAAKLLAKTKKYGAIICLGTVIRGETSHYDYVCQQVSMGCMKVMLKHEIPVIFGVLTTENEIQAQVRVDKGSECAEAALTMIKLAKEIDSN